MGNNVSIIHLLITDNSMLVIIWGCLAPNSSLFVCFTKMELHPVNSSSLAAGMISNFVIRGHQRATGRGRAACGCPSVWFPKWMTSPACHNQQHPAASSFLSTAGWGTALWTTPPAPQRAGLHWHSTTFSRKPQWTSMGNIHFWIQNKLFTVYSEKGSGRLFWDIYENTTFGGQ